MKIGIITIHYSFITRNYGSLMQLYAMQQVLEGMSVQSAPATGYIPDTWMWSLDAERKLT